MTEIERQRIDRAALVNELTQAGARFKGRECTCPFHPDKRPSAGIYPDDQGVWRFKCHAVDCGVGGDVWDIRAKLTGRPVEDILREARGVQDRRKPVCPTEGALEARLPGQIVSKHIYRDTRGRELMRVYRLDIGGEKSYRPARPVDGGWSLTAPPRQWPTYNQDQVVGADTVVVTEGEKCSDAMIALGIVATTGPGGAGKAEHIDWQLLAGKNVILWPDHDDAGHSHMKQVHDNLDRLQPRPRISRIDPAQLDLGHKEDAVDFIEQVKLVGGDVTTEIHKALSVARPIGPLAGYRDQQQSVLRGERRCIPWSWPEITRHTKALRPERVTVIAGKKGSTKSWWVLQNMLHWLESGIDASLLMLEGSVYELLDKGMAQLEGNAAFADLEATCALGAQAVTVATDRHEEELARLQASVTRASINITTEQVADWIENEAKQGRRIICADPVTAATRTGQPWVVDRLMLNRIRATAENYKCSVVLVSHLAKGATEFTTDALAGGACYEQNSDTIIQLHKHAGQSARVLRRTLTACGTHTQEEEVTYNVTAFIEKARAPGAGYKVAYNYDPKTCRLIELGTILKRRKDSDQ